LVPHRWTDLRAADAVPRRRPAARRDAGLLHADGVRAAAPAVAQHEIEVTGQRSTDAALVLSLSKGGPINWFVVRQAHHERCTEIADSPDSERVGGRPSPSRSRNPAAD